MFDYIKQMFTGEYDGGAYCDFTAVADAVSAGKDWLLAVWDATGANLLAVAGQQGLTINRSADTIEVSSKDTEGGWKSSIAGMKEWSIDVDGVFVPSDNSHKLLSAKFSAGEAVCLKIYDNKARKGLFGGLAAITDYPLEAPYDDSVTYSISLAGMGALVDLTVDIPQTDTLPQ